jgi:hypothetical protein
MKDSPPDVVTAHAEAARGLERIVQLETKLARVSLISREHRELTKAIEIAAAAYRMTLDNEQANATYDPHTLAGRAAVRRSPPRKLRSSKRRQS